MERNDEENLIHDLLTDDDMAFIALFDVEDRHGTLLKKIVRMKVSSRPSPSHHETTLLPTQSSSPEPSYTYMEADLPPSASLACTTWNSLNVVGLLKREHRWNTEGSSPVFRPVRNLELSYYIHTSSQHL